MTQSRQYRIGVYPGTFASLIKGQLIRTPVDTVRTTGRSAQGVTIFKVGQNENVVSVAWLIQEEGEESETSDSELTDPEVSLEIND
jgi:DNA gyrase subunit A